jgi:hypothetical protein
MKRFLFVTVLASMLVSGGLARAAGPTDNTVVFGAKVTVPSLVSALQANGYQALVNKPPNSPDSMLGIIATGVGGIKISIVAMKCEKSEQNDVCVLGVYASFNDDKNILDEKVVEVLNKKATFAKVTRIRRQDGTMGLNFVYMYICKEYTDTKFMTDVLQSFASDVVKVLAAYNSGQVTE